MERLRPGDVSPAVSLTPDEYRAAHDVSPLSPLTEDGLSPHLRRDASRRWRRALDAHQNVSPVSSFRVHPSVRGRQARPIVPVTTQLSPIEDRDQDPPPRSRSPWSEPLEFGQTPRLGLNQTVLESPTEGRRSSDGSFRGIPFDDVVRAKTIHGPPAKAGNPLTSSRAYWNPIWLRDYLLISLAVSFATVAIVIFAIYLVSSRNHGLGSDLGSQNLVHVWKYIPSAVIFLLFALWSRVDFTARLLQPWANMKNGPASAERSVFLDLITPILPAAFVRSFKTGSLVPILTILGAAILNVVVIFSTGLLQVERIIIVNDEFNLVKSAAIDATSWDPGGLDNTTAALYANIATGGLPWPDFATENAAFEHFTPQNGHLVSNISSYSGIVRGFFPTLDCEEARVERAYGSSATRSVNFTFASDSCRVVLQLPLINDLNTTASKNYMGTNRIISCPDDTKRMLSVVTVGSEKMGLLNSSALFCNPSYFVQNVEVTLRSPKWQPSMNADTVTAGTDQIQGLDSFELLDHILRSSSLANLTTSAQPSNITVTNDNFMRLASLTTEIRSTNSVALESFLDTTVFASQLQRAYSGMASLTASKSMMSDSQDVIRGTSTTSEDRVQVSLAATAVVVTLLLVCLGLSIAVLFRRPQEVVPRDPRSIGGIALLLQCNGELSHYFRSNLAHLRHSLYHERFFTLTPKTFSFTFAIVREGMNPAARPARTMSAEDGSMTWWQPMPLRAWSRISALVLSLALIGSLEGVQQVSDRSNGIATTKAPGAAQYGMTIIPAMVMLGVASLYSLINFNTALMAPYHALSKGATSDRSLFSHDLGRLPLVQLLTSLKRRQPATACSALSALLAPWLVIVVAGLYSTSSAGDNPSDEEARIVQNRGPKIALQVLLGVMVLCAAASWLSMLGAGGLLPHSPASIAGAAALLAGGELWKAQEEDRRRALLVPDGAEWIDDGELARLGVWENLVFGLGWWPDGRYGIDAGGRIDQEKRG
ncbi:hypothetical protein BJ166DRAFT_58101 [Pestalotiopsis sp. NC0098]|nr:hypothetical protein BJ166DRAFT_58101 [Pestalotiopsis sp. NC0098]